MALGSYRNSPFVTGHHSPTGSNRLVGTPLNGLETEILDYEAGKWEQADDYPYSAGDRYVNRVKSMRLWTIVVNKRFFVLSNVKIQYLKYLIN